MSDRDLEAEEQEQLAEVAERLRASRGELAMTLYAIGHGRRTPEQVREVVDRAKRAIQRSQLVRRRWLAQWTIH